MSGWTVPLDVLVKGALNKLETVARKTVVEVYKGVIMDTPVDTGNARGNWMATVGAPYPVEVESRDASGGTAVARVVDVGTGQWKPLTGHPFYLSNNCRYIKRLNEGSSKQAPARFVELNVARVGGIADDAAGGAL